jgi:eukaryotic-like serine/threonine-protein kinase
MSRSTERLTAALDGRYRIERELGQGGMATVYLAEDLKHDRKVALKVLKPELAAVLGAERFVVEIKTTAALQHPHILPLFDSGTADGFLFYVMPFIDGETLREKLNRETQLGVDEAVKIAAEVADALDYAHQHGVIHRDIKPENILLANGRPMVADFGIALAVSAAAGGRMTETGLSLGTPYYMSPEQATADKDITGRSDIYSLASVLYEMLAGEPPHMGNSAQQIIMKIIAEPVQPVTALRKSTPAHVAATLAKALEKLPADRFATAREFAEGLAGRGLTPDMLAATGATAAGALRRGVWRHPLVIGLGVALIATIGLAAGQWNAARRNAPEVVRFTLGLPSSGKIGGVQGTNIAISPDGRTVAYVLAEAGYSPRIYVRRLDDDAPRLLAGTDGAQQPCFSPDGRWIGYLIGDVVWKVEVAGGTPVVVGSVNGAPVGLTWTAGGELLTGTPRGIVAIPAGGGAARVIAAPDLAAGELYFNQPRVLPDGSTVLFAVQPTGGLSGSRLGTLSLRTGKVTRYDVSLLDPLGIMDGLLVYVTPTGALVAIRLDLGAGRVVGDPIALGPLVRTDVAGSSQAALSPTGTLIYQPGNAEAVIGWVEPGKPFEPLLTDVRAYGYPRLSPDGQRIAMTVRDGGRSDIWLYDIVQATPMRLTSAGSMSDRPEWSPDGRRVLYRADRGSRTAIWWQPADQSAQAEPLLASDAHDFYEGVMTPDGKGLVYQVDDAGSSQADVMYRGLSGDTATVVISATSFQEHLPRISPDGRWVAFVTNASGRFQVVVQPLQGGTGRVQVSGTGGDEPVWAPDGRRIFYRDGRSLVAASVTTSPQFAVTGRVELFPDEYAFAEAPHANYDVSRDGSRFLMVKRVQAPELSVVYGWREELHRRLKETGGTQ